MCFIRAIYECAGDSRTTASVGFSVVDCMDGRVLDIEFFDDESVVIVLESEGLCGG